jgi:hypothetical protein
MVAEYQTMGRLQSVETLFLRVERAKTKILGEIFKVKESKI